MVTYLRPITSDRQSLAAPEPLAHHDICIADLPPPANSHDPIDSRMRGRIAEDFDQLLTLLGALDVSVRH